MILQRLKYRAHRVPGIDWLFHRKALCDHSEELFTRAYLLRFSGRMPCLVIDAADQHRELVTELGCLVDDQAIPQAVKHRAQDVISAVPLEPQLVADFLEPCICLVNGFVEHFEAGHAHGRTFWIEVSRYPPPHLRVSPCIAVADYGPKAPAVALMTVNFSGLWAAGARGRVSQRVRRGLMKGSD